MRSDAEIQKNVLEELKWAPNVHATHIGVSVSDAVVTLTGWVPSYAEKWAAEKVVERVAGVKAIADELEVKLPGESRRNDAELAKAAADALKWNTWVPDTVKVLVDNGWVTLNGEVEWAYQRDEAENAVRNLAGVVGITNEIKVKSSVRPNPAEIKQKIVESLKRTALEEAQNIEVEVKGSKVVLKGKVHSFDEYWAAKNTAWSAPGVEEVEADLKIAA